MIDSHGDVVLVSLTSLTDKLAGDSRTTCQLQWQSDARTLPHL